MKSCIFILLLFFSCKSLWIKKELPIKGERFVYVSAVGDVMVHSTQLNSAYDKDCKCWKFESVFQEVKKKMENYDLNICNLETTLPGNKKMFSGYPSFGSPNSLATALKKTGFNVVTTANNHSVDKGSLGIDNTIKVLEKNNLLHLGTYSSLTEYQKNRVLFIKKNDILFAFLNYTYGTNGIPVPKGKVVNLIDRNLLTKDVALARKKKADVIVVYFHFGEEYQRLPNTFQKNLVSFAFKEGVDIVLGSHPHVLQPFELKSIKDRFGVVKKRLVIYSLGNFVSSQHKRYTNGGIIFGFELKKTIYKNSSQVEIENIHYIPVWVYVQKSKIRSKYYVIPVEDYLSSVGNIKITQKAIQRMKQFYSDTKTHFKRNSYIERDH